MLAGGVLNGAFAVGDELRAALAVAGLTTDWTSNVLLQLSFSGFEFLMQTCNLCCVLSATCFGGFGTLFKHLNFAALDTALWRTTDDTWA
jgi:hypothetical protein